MSTTAEDVMTTNPVMCDLTTTLAQAASAMRERNIGDVLVMDSDHLHGIVTDRDIVVRAVADGLDPNAVTLAEICAGETVTVAPDDPIERVVDVMRDAAVRRLPVCVGDWPIGIVSLGDLALDRDRESALADISAAPPNR